MTKIPHPAAVRAPVMQQLAFGFGAALIGSLLLALSARVQVPFWPVPMTMQALAVLVIGMTLRARLGATVVAIYVLEGLLGLPVFAGTPERGLGFAYLLGPTGGYLIGFVLAAYVAGWLAERGYGRTLLRAVLAQAAGTAIILSVGCAWLAAQFGVEKAITAGLLPFVLASLVKIGLGAVLVVGIERRR